MQGMRAIRRSAAHIPVSGRRPLLAIALTCASSVVLLAALAPVGAGARALQADPRVAPATQLSADGRTSTDGQRTLTVSQAVELDPAGQAIGVAGSGYDATKGIYVALCVIPPRNVLPTPCGGGVDTEGQAGASQWISSSPPDYGVGLATPYGPGGSFSTTFTVRAQIAAGIDCRQVRCAILTRSDHTRTADRSQDIMIPVAFRSDPGLGGGGGGAGGGAGGGGGTGGGSTGGGATATTAPPTVAVPSTAVPTTAPSRAPQATLDATGRSVTDGTRTLEASHARGLDPTGTTVSVSGRGFDERTGVYVSLCAAATEPTAAPGPCAAGAGRSTWISSTAPDATADLAVGWGPGGTFEAQLELAAAIDADHDCREVPCAVVVRFDDQRPDDRSGDLALPVRFLDESPTPTTEGPTDEAAEAAGPGDDERDDAAETAAAGEAEDRGSSSVLPVAAAVVAVPLVGGLAWALRRRARAGSQP